MCLFSDVAQREKVKAFFSAHVILGEDPVNASDSVHLAQIKIIESLEMAFLQFTSQIIDILHKYLMYIQKQAFSGSNSIVKNLGIKLF